MEIGAVEAIVAVLGLVFLFGVIGMGLTGTAGYMKLNQFLFGRQIKNEMRQEILDKRQLDEIATVKREIDKIESKLEKIVGGKQ